MWRYSIPSVLMVLFLMVFVSACSPKPPEDKIFEDFKTTKFDNSTTIDNQWFPLKPGKQLVFEGETMEKDGPVPHRVIINVTDLVKVISGVRSVVTWDLDYSAEQLVEAEVAFFAQDNNGTVWRMGEYPEEYQDGKMIDNPTWIHGLDNALAGIAMLANPQPGLPDYAPEILNVLSDVVKSYAPDMGKLIIPFKQVVFGFLIVSFLIFEPRGLAEIWNRIKKFFTLWPFSY